MACHRRHVAALSAALVGATCLSGCAGGPIARQMASSLAMRAADRAIDLHLANQEQPPAQTSRPMMTTSRLSPDMLAFMMATLPAMPRPAEAKPAPPPAPEPEVKISKLVPVRVHNFIIGEEKAEILASHPVSPDALSWRLAEGGMAETADQALVFLVPPELERISSGDIAVVELDDDGGLAIARDKF